MALHVTQCPRCESTFNTSARMLQAAHGLVRCGACLSIFEADQHFVGMLSPACNDDPDPLDGESVFISAPEDYFDPSEFLEQDQNSQDNAGDFPPEGEILYAKSDVKDSNFDVFDVEPEEQDSLLIKEQLIDSDFDVFDAGEAPDVRPANKPKVQDSEFDIYDAGERKLLPLELDGGANGGQFQVKASFNFAAGSSGANYGSLDLPALLLTDLRRTTRRKSPASADEARAASPAARPQAGGSADTEVILPHGPDAATMLAALKKANEQSKNRDPWEDCETADGDELLYDELDFPPGGGKFLDADDIDPEHHERAADESVEVFFEDTEWEEAEVELDEKSFVILPANPYQPSAFLSDTEAMPDKPKQEKKKKIKVSPESTPAKQADSGGSTPSAEGTSGDESDRQPAENAARAARQADDAPSNNDGDAPDPVQQPATGDKNEIRARMVFNAIDDHDDTGEWLSEENLRAVRDVDNSLEIEQRGDARRSSRVALVATACVLLMLVFTLQFFWQRMEVFSQDARFRPWYQTVCGFLGCELPDYVNPELIITDNLVVRSHPQQADQLELTAVFRNRAEFPQPFPLIELRFSDLNNRTVTSRQLTPDEYLAPALRGMPLMPIGAPVQITLELDDPGPEAVNYQLGFKAAPPRPRS